MPKYTIHELKRERITFSERHALGPLVKRADEAREGGSNDEEIEALWDLVDTMLPMLGIEKEG